MKTTSLPSVEDRVKTICSCRKGSMDDKQYEATVEYNLTEDRNQAYTSLVALITEHAQSPKSFNPLDLLEDIDKLYGVKENVVKPLYGKK